MVTMVLLFIVISIATKVRFVLGHKEVVTHSSKLVLESEIMSTTF
jgi:hypothetical protein